MAWEQEKEEIARELTPRLYREGYIETIFTTKIPKHIKDGWLLKSGLRSPWYLNLRPVGSSPRLLADIGEALALLFENEMPECNKILGVDMAGIPIATATSIVSLERRGVELPFAYTRPLPGGEKPRTADAMRSLLSDTEMDYAWGGHELVEGRFYDGDSVAIWDDMATNIESKRIARELLLYEAKRLGLSDIKCDHTGFLLYRGGPISETDIADMKPHYIIPFNEKGLDWLKDVMDPKEHELITDYQHDPERYIGDTWAYVMKHRTVPPIV